MDEHDATALVDTPKETPAVKPPRKRRAVTGATIKQHSLSGVPGRKSLFRNKIRNPVSITLTSFHHAKIERAKIRLGLTRADLIGLLIEKYADTVTIAG